MKRNKYTSYAPSKIKRAIELLETNTVSEVSRLTGIKTQSLYYWINKRGADLKLTVPLQGQKRKQALIDHFLKNNT